ncbi:hypothetical protein OAT67_05050 [Bacteriovoracaceae bacterium]|nr:hypothetical protein [Bacteriovoracaceae bacterium]
MRRRQNDEVLRVLTLLKIDADRLFERIKKREVEYMQVFSAKRTREHFKDIFKNKYETISFSDLKLCSEEVMMGLDNFYTLVDEMRWYLAHTEEMPGTVTERVNKLINEMEKCHDTLSLYIGAEIDLQNNEDSPLAV